MFQLPLSKWNNGQMKFLFWRKKKGGGGNAWIGTRVLIMWSAEVALVLSEDVRNNCHCTTVHTSWPHWEEIVKSLYGPLHAMITTLKLFIFNKNNMSLYLHDWMGWLPMTTKTTYMTDGEHQRQAYRTFVISWLTLWSHSLVRHQNHL